MAEPRNPEKKTPRSTHTRSRGLYIGSLIILAIVIVTFIGAPVVTRTAGRSHLVFGRYGNEEIRYQPGNFFARQYEAIAQSLRDSGNQANLELQLRIAWREAFNRAVLHTAVLQAADRAGMDVSSERVDELIASDPRFQVNGRFDTQAYQNIGNQERFQLRNYHRESAIFDQVIRDVLAGAESSDGEKQFVAEMSGPERSFEVVRFPFTEFPAEQVRTFASENDQLFTTLDLAVVTLSSEDEASQIREQALQPGNPIGDLARTYSRDLYADQDGQIGPVYGYELQQELTNPDDLQKLLDLQPGDTSEPLETTAGWAFYQALSAPAPFDPQADGAIADVRTYMQNFEQGRIQDYVRAEAESFATQARTDGFATAADGADRTILNTPFFPINYGNIQLFGQLQSAQIPDLADAAYRQDFFESAFGLAADEISDPVVLRQSVLIMRLREERPAQESNVAFIRDYYGSLERQFKSDALQTAFVDDRRLEDNFAQAFNRYVLGPNSN